jgi:hypothetical protein
MKVIAIGLNLLLVIYILYMFITIGAPTGKDEMFLVILSFAAPVASVVALFLKGGESWLGLYFKRKALEEKKKIGKLEAKE